MSVCNVCNESLNVYFNYICMVLLLVLVIFDMLSGHMKKALCEDGREEDMQITGAIFKLYF